MEHGHARLHTFTHTRGDLSWEGRKAWELGVEIGRDRRERGRGGGKDRREERGAVWERLWAAGEKKEHRKVSSVCHLGYVQN